MSYIEDCTNEVGGGVELGPFKVVRLISEWLYTALQAAFDIGSWISKTMYIVLPSGLAFKILDGGEVPDFTLDPVYFWAWQVSLFGIPLPPVPLKKIDFFEVLTNILMAMDIEIPGSQYLTFKDYDGTYRQGINCTPPRGYNLISNQAYDIYMFNLIIAVFILIKELGLVGTALRYLRNAISWISNYRMRIQVSDIYEDLQELGEMIGNNDEESILEKLDDLSSELTEIKNKIGLRHVFR